MLTHHSLEMLKRSIWYQASSSHQAYSPKR